MQNSCHFATIGKTPQTLSHLQYASREIDHHQIGTTTEGHNFYDFSATMRLIIMGFWDRRDRCPFFTIMNYRDWQKLSGQNQIHDATAIQNSHHSSWPIAFTRSHNGVDFSEWWRLMNGLPPVGARHWEREWQGEFHFGKSPTLPVYQSLLHTTLTSRERASISLVAVSLGSYLHATFIISFNISIRTNIPAELL